MQFNENGNRDFLFGITLTEIILMLFFLLLLISAFISVQKSSEISKIEEEKMRVVRENNALKHYAEISKSLSEQMIDAMLRFKFGDDNEANTQQIFKELSNQTRLIAENEALKTELEAYQQNVKLLEMDEAFKIKLSRKEALLKKLESIKTLEDMKALFKEFEDAQMELDKSNVREKELIATNQKLEKLLKEVSSMSAEELAYAQEILKGQVSYLTRRLNQSGGNELPPCWANVKTGKAEYLFSVIIGENGLRVKPRWPKYRTKEMKKYGSLRALYTKEISVKRFLQLTKPIYKDADKNECKHYLYLFDKATTKDGYKQKRFALENYFYKYESHSK